MGTDDFLAKRKTHDVGRWYVNRFVERVAAQLPGGASLLDAGAGECAYKRLFSHCTYRAIDLAVGDSRWSYGELDYVAPLHAMPIADGVFDAVLCTQTLEHLEWPRESVQEMYRVLKPGGTLFLTAPMAHPEHQTPNDFFRYTSCGIRSICSHAGFQHVTVTPFGGLWVRWAYEMPRALQIFPSAGIRSGKPHAMGMALLPVKLAARPMVRLLQTVFLLLDRYDRAKNDPFGWACTAIK